MADPTSVLAEDDRKSRPYLVSTTITYCLSGGIDHLCAVRSLLETGRIPLHALYTLLRACIENTCVALWLLWATDSTSRIARQLRLTYKDFDNADRAAQSFGLSVALSRDDRIVKLTTVAERNRISRRKVKERVTYEAIVCEVGAEIHGAEMAPFHAWKVCSAVAHGDAWALANVLSREPRSATADGTVNYSITADSDQIFAIATEARSLLSAAIEGFDELAEGRS